MPPDGLYGPDCHLSLLITIELCRQVSVGNLSRLYGCVCVHLSVAVARAKFSYNVFCSYMCMQGGRPSPFDRNMGSRMAIKCAEKLLEQIQASKTPDGLLLVNSV